MFPPLLFNKVDIFSVCENQKKALKNAAASHPEPHSPFTDDEVVEQLVERFDVEVPTLLDDKMTVSQKEIDLDVSRDPRRMFINRGSPFYIKGTRITIHIPFTGEAEFFDVRPSTYTLSPPRGTVSKKELLLTFEYPNDLPPPDLKRELHSLIQQIKGSLNTLRESTDRLRGELRNIAMAAWQQRKLQFTSKSQVIAGLGLPLRSETTPASPPATPKRQPVNHGKIISPAPPLTRVSPTRSTNNWHIFISHASEDKAAIAKPLADAFINEGFSVWYDDYTLEVGDSLRKKIDEGLSKSDFGIVILSKAFFSKHWPQQELNGLASRESQGKKVILPVWHDITRDEVTAASPILADRLGVPTSLGLDHVVARLVKAMK